MYGQMTGCLSVVTSTKEFLPKRNPNNQKEQRTKNEHEKKSRYLLGGIQCTRYLFGGIQYRRYLLGDIKVRGTFSAASSVGSTFCAVSRVGGTLLAVLRVGGTFLAEAVKPKYDCILWR